MGTLDGEVKVMTDAEARENKSAARELRGSAA
jgi:hypothetical protein